ncbi:DUF530 family protein [Methanocaldococcus infernus]|uniref:Uncharacterized protein n=1 Tax=Methanocaldococcus infernus (strain DSM 11812 / JCM 15783 / ME) TaxID=573063 RepID=D5VU28_METIM|nr:DUF530 family protein [Methanocaldococcus infernus]ADG14081.1 Protein of unknown function DUF530 [Methanocaldococcus infernus ME]
MESSTIIKKVNEFLDSIKNINKEIEEALKKNKVDNIIKKLRENLEILHEFKAKMEFLEFDSPYKNIVKIKADSESAQEISNFSSYLRRVANEKKASLERVKHALASHKMAIAHLTDDIGNKKIVVHLPLDGSYKEKIFTLPTYLIALYKDFLDVLEPKGRGVLTSYTISFISFKDGKRSFNRVKVEDPNYEKYLKERFGNVIITGIKKNYSKNKLIEDQHVRKCLAISYIYAYKDEIEEEIERRLKNILNEKERRILKEYLELCKDFKDECDVFGGILDVRALEEKMLKELNFKKLLEERGLYKDGEPIEELRKAIEVKETISKEVGKDIVLRKFSEDIFKFYLYKNPDERSRSSLFPSIITTPNISYLNWLKLDIDGKKVLDIKFKLEPEFPKYNLSTKYLGGAILYLLYDWDTVERYGFKRKDVEDLLKKMALVEPIKEMLKDKVDIKKLERFGKVKKKKTKKFLEALGGL